MVTVEVTEHEFHLSNTALLATWPEHDRQALARAQPLGDARWPEVDEQIDARGDDIGIPALRDAFGHASNVDHARASLAGETGTPIAFAIRAAPDVRFVRVLQAIYAAGLAGYAEPRLVLLSTSSEVLLELPLPRVAPAREAGVARDLARALAAAGLEGRTRPPTDPPEEPATDAPAVGPTTAQISIVLAEDGLHITRDLHALAPGCRDTAESDVLTITAAELVPSTLTACLDAAGEIVMLTFRTAPDTRYAEAVAVLETLAARGPVGLAVTR